MFLCRNKLRILAALPARWIRLKNVTGIYDNALRKHLKGLESAGFIVKKGGMWMRTSRGEKLLREIVACEASVLEMKLEIKQGGLRDMVFQRFKHTGFAAALQKPLGFFEAAPIISDVKDLVLTLPPSRFEDDYLWFAAELYVNSVKSFLGLEAGRLNYVELRAAWQIIGLNAWRERIEEPCLIFDFPGAWCRLHMNLPDNLKKRLEELDGDKKNQRWRMFRRLKLWSFPVTERFRLLEKIPYRPTR